MFKYPLSRSELLQIATQGGAYVTGTGECFLLKAVPSSELEKARLGRHNMLLWFGPDRQILMTRSDCQVPDRPAPDQHYLGQLNFYKLVMCRGERQFQSFMHYRGARYAPRMSCLQEADAVRCSLDDLGPNPPTSYPDRQFEPGQTKRLIRGGKPTAGTYFILDETNQLRPDFEYATKDAALEACNGADIVAYVSVVIQMREETVTTVQVKRVVKHANNKRNRP